MTNNKNIFILGAVGFLLLLITVMSIDNWRFISDSYQRIEAGNSVDQEETFEYQITNFKNEKFGDNGVIDFSLEARDLEFYQGSQKSLLTDPFITVFTKNQQQPSWTIKSENAYSVYPNEEVNLSGNVVLHRMSLDPDQSDLFVRSQSMKLFINQKQVLSEDVVKISSERGLITGKAFKADLTSNSLSLGEAVQSTYR